MSDRLRMMADKLAQKTARLEARQNVLEKQYEAEIARLEGELREAHEKIREIRNIAVGMPCSEKTGWCTLDNPTCALHRA